MGGQQSVISQRDNKMNQSFNKPKFVSCDPASDEKESGIKNIGKLSSHERELLETLRIGSRLVGHDCQDSTRAASLVTRPQQVRHRFSLHSQSVISCGDQANVFKIKRKQNGGLVSSFV